MSAAQPSCGEHASGVTCGEHASGMPPVTVAAILRAVSAEWAIPETELLAHRRAPATEGPRCAVMGLARAMTPHSFPALGRMLKRDHTTVLAASRRHAERMENDPHYAARIRAVSERLQRSMSDA